MITTQGIIIQIRMSDIKELSRITSGVKLMDLKNGVKVAKIAKVRNGLGLSEATSEDGDDEEYGEDMEERVREANDAEEESEE